jgi:hypothetical protein
LLRCEATRIGRAKLSPSPCKRPGHDLKVLNYSPSFSLLETQQGGRAPFRAPTRFPVRCRSPVARAHFTQRTAAHRQCWRLAAARLPPCRLTAARLPPCRLAALPRPLAALPPPACRRSTRAPEIQRETQRHRQRHGQALRFHISPQCVFRTRPSSVTS